MKVHPPYLLYQTERYVWPSLLPELPLSPSCLPRYVWLQLGNSRLQSQRMVSLSVASQVASAPLMTWRNKFVLCQGSPSKDAARWWREMQEEELSELVAAVQAEQWIHTYTRTYARAISWSISADSVYIMWHAGFLALLWSFMPLLLRCDCYADLFLRHPSIIPLRLLAKQSLW